jgi:uncharacterized protein YigA (DUF484 family)
VTKISNETPNASTADPIEQAESALQTHPVAADLDSAAVAAWLMAHPDFFQDHPEALTAVELQHASGAAVSLIERQVQALRTRNQELEKQLRDLVGFARENDKLSEGMHRLSLSLMDAEDREEIEHLVYESLRGYFQVEFVAVRIAPEVEQLEAFRRFFRESMPHCGIPDSQQMQWLFNEQAASVQSVALIPLGDFGDFGLIALGSRDRNRYRAGVGVHFLTHLGALVTTSLRPCMLQCAKHADMNDAAGDVLDSVANEDAH